MSQKDIVAIYPLSPAQQGMLYDTLRMEQSGIHVEQFICTLICDLDSHAFKQAWQHIISAHALLRTGFVWEGQTEPLQVVLRQVEPAIKYVDWRQISQDEQEKKLEAYIERDRLQSFKLSQAPLMRIALFQTDDNHYQLVWTHHHILMDGWCRTLVLKELCTCYQALYHQQIVSLPSHRQYKDYVAWLNKQDLVAAQNFWKETLQGFTHPTIPGDEVIVSGKTPPEEHFASAERHLSPAISTRLQSLVNQQRLTLNTLIQGIWALLLGTYSKRDDVVFGITLSGRPSTIAGIETMVGLCINTLPVRVKVNQAEDFWQWLQTIQAYNLELRQYEYSPASRVHEWSDVPGSLPLYHTLLVVENYPMDSSFLNTPELMFTNVRPQGGRTQYPLTLMVTVGTEMEIFCVSDTTRISSLSVSTILDHFELAIEHVMRQPEIQVSALSSLLAGLPVPQFQTYRQQEEIVAPRTTLEEVLMEIWTDVLGVPVTSVNDNFLEIGGHSLLATQLIARLRTALNIDVKLRTLFEAPTIALFAKHLAAQTTKEEQPVPMVQAPRTQELPLSLAQQRLWFLDRLVPGNTSYNISRPIRISGPLRIDILSSSLKEIFRRHEILRTNIVTKKDHGMQVIAPSVDLALPQVDLSQLPMTQRERMAMQLIQSAAQRSFDLAHDLLLRITIFRMSPEEHILLIVVHHIIFDAWSEGIFRRELAALYEAYANRQPSPLPPLALQYVDFAAWQQQWLQGEVLKPHIVYWKKQLYHAPLLQLPVDHPGSSPGAFKGALQSWALPPDLSSALKKLSRQEGVTLFMVLLAAYQVLLYRLTNQDDIIVGTDVANRPRIEMEAMIGFFVNILALRTNLSGNPPFRVLLQRVKEMVLGAYTHQELPFERLVEILQLERTGQQIPLIRALFVLQNIPMPALQIHDLTFQSLPLEMNTTNFDLAVFMWEEDNRLVGGINYRSDLFEAQTITNIIERFQVLLQSIVDQPNRPLDMLKIDGSNGIKNSPQEDNVMRNKRKIDVRSIKRSEIKLSSPNP